MTLSNSLPISGPLFYPLESQSFGPDGLRGALSHHEYEILFLRTNHIQDTVGDTEKQETEALPSGTHSVPDSKKRETGLMP